MIFFTLLSNKNVFGYLLDYVHIYIIFKYVIAIHPHSRLFNYHHICEMILTRKVHFLKNAKITFFEFFISLMLYCRILEYGGKEGANSGKILTLGLSIIDFVFIYISMQYIFGIKFN